MGTAPMLRPGQMNTSIYIELGNGDSFIFDMGEGAVSNYLGSGIPINKLNDIFLTHLHVDHFGSIPWVYAFGAWSGRWHEPLRITGPSGRTEKDGIKYMVEGMKQMMHWHRELQSRTRCVAWISCCSTRLTVTKRMFSRLMASQIASASRASFLLLFTYGFTNCGAINLTV